MEFDDSTFFTDNIATVNKLVAKVLLCTNILGPLFIVLTKLSVFQISNRFSLLILVTTLLFSATIIVLVFVLGGNQFRNQYPEAFNATQKFAMYFELCFSAVLLGIMGTHPHIGIYISYATIVFLSCLYYDKNVSVTMTFICYLVMMASLFFKSLNRVTEALTSSSVYKDFLAYASGYTIEFFFVLLITIKMSSRNHKSMQMILEKNIKIENTNIEIMQFMPEVLKKHEIITGLHTEHTVNYVDMICRELRSQGLFTDVLSDETIKLYAAAANLHDIGKIFIPDHILNTPRRYTAQEYEMMKRHPEIGKEILEKMPLLWDGRFNKIAIDMAYCHHERYDGTGYPQGLKGDEIPLSARIMAVADVTDALLSRRPYKQEMKIEDAMQILREGRGTQFDPIIVDALLSVQPLVYMYSQDVAANEFELIKNELEWRQQNMDSIAQSLVISVEKQKEIMMNS